MSEREASPPSDEGGEVGGGRTRRRPPVLGAALRRAWVGYQQRLDQKLAAAGFADRGFPDGRVLWLCAQFEDVTASQIGREIGITRQGAGKVVAALHDRGFVTLRSSPSDGREKVVSLTPRAHEYLAALRSGSRQIERDLRKQIGSEAFESLFALLEALGGEDQPRMRTYLRRTLRDTEDIEGDATHG
ncbi:MAG: MarR family winged helix-turn-helix transcriptional regulator [Acidimicrobiales bacterium]